MIQLFKRCVVGCVICLLKFLNVLFCSNLVLCISKVFESLDIR